MIERQARERAPDLDVAGNHRELVGGERSRRRSLCSSAENRGVSSLGFSITRLPAASAAATGSIAELDTDSSTG